MSGRGPSTTRLARGWERTQSVLLEGTGRQILDQATGAGRGVMLFADVLGQLGQLGRCRATLLRQLASAGFGSLLILSLIAGLTGMIMSMQTGAALEPYGVIDQLGAIIAITFCRELGPIWAAVIVLARVGASMAAEIGTMVVNEEVDALRCMSIDPVRYLVLPRVVALVLAMPILAAVADLVGILGGGLVASSVFGLPMGAYLEAARTALQPIDFFSGLFKAAVFGVIIAVVACARRRPRR